jgi:hypothetical protein
MFYGRKPAALEKRSCRDVFVEKGLFGGLYLPK